MKYRVGDWVEVLSPEEVLQTLDDKGAVGNMPFMPEMLKFAGKRLQVSASAHKACDTIDSYRNREVEDAVHLGVRCDGSAHGGCQAGCLLFWKEAWLEPVGSRREAGAGEGAKTVIPAEATAKVSMRLVPKQKLATVEKQLATAVKRLAPKHVTATVRFLHGADPAQIKVNSPAFNLLGQAFKEVTVRASVPARAGGSIPVVPALASAGAPVILTGIGLPDDRLHAPNEKLDLKQLWDGIEVFRRFYELLGGNNKVV